MSKSDLDISLSSIVAQSGHIASRERAYVDTFDMMDVRADGWRQMGLFNTADARDINISLAIISRGGNVVGE